MLVAVLGRPSSWNWLLLAHMAAAFFLVGGVLVVTLAGLAASRSRPTSEIALLRRVAYRANLILVLPGFIAVVALGQGLVAKEDSKGTWLDVAYPVTYLSALLGGVVLTLLQRRAMRQAEAGQVDGSRSGRLATALGPLVLAALFVIIWVMATKPGA